MFTNIVVKYTVIKFYNLVNLLRGEYLDLKIVVTGYYKASVTTSKLQNVLTQDTI
jgi:hypothetical protein